MIHCKISVQNTPWDYDEYVKSQYGWFHQLLLKTWSISTETDSEACWPDIKDDIQLYLKSHLYVISYWSHKAVKSITIFGFKTLLKLIELSMKNLKSGLQMISHSMLWLNPQLNASPKLFNWWYVMLIIWSLPGTNGSDVIVLIICLKNCKIMRVICLNLICQASPS